MRWSARRRIWEAFGKCLKTIAFVFRGCEVGRGAEGARKWIWRKVLAHRARKVSRRSMLTRGRAGQGVEGGGPRRGIRVRRSTATPARWLAPARQRTPAARSRFSRWFGRVGTYFEPPATRFPQ